MNIFKRITSSSYTHLCGVVDILKGRVTGHHGSKIREGAQAIEPALCVIRLGALKKVDHWWSKGRWHQWAMKWLRHLWNVTGLPGRFTTLEMHCFYCIFTTFMTFHTSFLMQILTNLSKQNADDALDADQCPGEPEPLSLVSMTIISSSASQGRQNKTVLSTKNRNTMKL